MIESAGIRPLRRPDEGCSPIFLGGMGSPLVAAVPGAAPTGGDVIQVEQDGQGPLVPASSGRMESFNPHPWQWNVIGGAALARSWRLSGCTDLSVRH